MEGAAKQTQFGVAETRDKNERGMRGETEGDKSQIMKDFVCLNHKK